MLHLVSEYLTVPSDHPKVTRMNTYVLGCMVKRSGLVSMKGQFFYLRLLRYSSVSLGLGPMVGVIRSSRNLSCLALDRCPSGHGM